jgi:Ras GTPase-activating-like protein IQGAP2/3
MHTVLNRIKCFVFIVTDLYDKKNIPKVIYCIHALAHLLARRGMAARIGNLVGRLKFTDDQLQQTQRGLKAAGVAMPNFGNIGLDLANEINEEVEQDVETEDESECLFMVCLINCQRWCREGSNAA